MENCEENVGFSVAWCANPFGLQLSIHPHQPAFNNTSHYHSTSNFNILYAFSFAVLMFVHSQLFWDLFWPPAPPAPSVFRQALLDNDISTAQALMVSGEAEILEAAGNNLALAIDLDRDLELIRAMIDQSDLETLNHTNDVPAIHAAARCANATVVELLIQAAANVLIRDRVQRAPLFSAVVLSRTNMGRGQDQTLFPKVVQTVRLLIEHGAIVNHESPGLVLIPRYCICCKDASLPIDPNLVTLLVAEGAHTPPKNWLDMECPMQANAANAAIEEGRLYRDAPPILRSELERVLLPPLLAIIADYVYVPINQAPTNT